MRSPARGDPRHANGLPTAAGLAVVGYFLAAGGVAVLATMAPWIVASVVGAVCLALTVGLVAWYLLRSTATAPTVMWSRTHERSGDLEGWAEVRRARDPSAGDCELEITIPGADQIYRATGDRTHGLADDVTIGAVYHVHVDQLPPRRVVLLDRLPTGFGGSPEKGMEK